MAETLLLLVLITGFLFFLVFLSIRGRQISKKRLMMAVVFFLVTIISLFIHTGAGRIKGDIARIIHNSRPKKPEEVYELLFSKPADSCMRVINFKDQLIPKIDCCIWMELELCPPELTRIILLKKYQVTRYSKPDSLYFLSSFSGRPAWWIPQAIGDSVTKCNIKWNADKEQSLFFGNDSMHVYVCDQAL